MPLGRQSPPGGVVVSLRFATLIVLSCGLGVLLIASQQAALSALPPRNRGSRASSSARPPKPSSQLDGYARAKLFAGCLRANASPSFRLPHAIDVVASESQNFVFVDNGAPVAHRPPPTHCKLLARTRPHPAPPPRHARASQGGLRLVALSAFGRPQRNVANHRRQRRVVRVLPVRGRGLPPSAHANGLLQSSQQPSRGRQIALVAVCFQRGARPSAEV